MKREVAMEANVIIIGGGPAGIITALTAKIIQHEPFKKVA